MWLKLSNFDINFRHYDLPIGIDAQINAFAIGQLPNRACGVEHKRPSGLSLHHSKRRLISRSVRALELPIRRGR